MKEIDEKLFEEYKQAYDILQNRLAINSVLTLIRETDRVQTFAVEEKNVRRVNSVQLPKEGGILTFIDGEKFARKGYPDSAAVQKIDDLKKTLMGLARGFIDFRGKLILCVSLFFFRRRLARSLYSFIDKFHFTFAFHLLKPFRYCPAARALYDAMTNPDDWQIRDLLCMTLEFDDAYRYRFQDAFGELDCTRLAKNPILELDRILSLLQSRESDIRLKSTWKMARQFLFLSFFFKGLRNKILDVAFNLDPERIKMDEADRHFASFKEEYAWSEDIKS